MYKRANTFLPATVLALAAALPVVAQQQTVGLFLHDPRAEEGYTLMSPRGNSISYLLDNDGLVVHRWTASYPPGSMAYMMEDGHLVRAERLAIPPSNFLGGAGRGGYLEKFDWDGNLVWEFMYSTQEHLSHHDIEVLPDGNVLMIAWEYKTHTEALQAGRDPGLINQGLWPDHVIEVQPTPPFGGIIVWEWHVWDHLVQDYNSAVDNFGVVTAHPELVDINYVIDDGDADWTHVNGIAYNAALDQIVISVRRFDEFWVIDHSTSTSEAAGHTGGNSGKGGDLLYRWGNPQVYGRGTEADHRLFGQHDAQWIDPGLPGAGNFLVYDNGVSNPVGQFSFVKEIVPPVDEHGAYAIDPGEPFGPHEPTWVYPDAPDPAFYSGSVSGVQRQPGGTSLICEGGSGHLFEVTPDGERVWDYVNPVAGAAIVSQGDPIDYNRVFKVRRYPPDFPAFDGRDLTPGDPLENFTPPYPPSDGSLVAARLTPAGDTLWVSWDADSCQSFDYKLIYGRLDELPDHAMLEAVCAIGVSGSYTWSGVPADSLYFLVVGTDPTGVYESSWGVASDGAERNSTTSSFTCGTTTKIVSSQCP